MLPYTIKDMMAPVGDMDGITILNAGNSIDYDIDFLKNHGANFLKLKSRERLNIDLATDVLKDGCSFKVANNSIDAIMTSGIIDSYIGQRSGDDVMEKYEALLRFSMNLDKFYPALKLGGYVINETNLIPITKIRDKHANHYAQEKQELKNTLLEKIGFALYRAEMRVECTIRHSSYKADINCAFQDSNLKIVEQFTGVRDTDADNILSYVVVAKKVNK